MTHAVEVNRIF